MRFKKSPQVPGAGRTRAWYHHGSHTPTYPGAILLGKIAYHTKQIRRQCTTSQRKLSGLFASKLGCSNTLEIFEAINRSPSISVLYICRYYIPRRIKCRFGSFAIAHLYRSLAYASRRIELILLLALAVET